MFMGMVDRLRLCFSLGLFAEYSGVFLVDPNICSKHENVVEIFKDPSDCEKS
jgi:hypothetical protein